MMDKERFEAKLPADINAKFENLAKQSGMTKTAYLVNLLEGRISVKQEDDKLDKILDKLDVIVALIAKK